MLQNRVDPFGNIIKTKARGCWTGNRGVLHNAQQEIVRSYKLKAWITCKLEFKGWKRKVMSPDRWTELFFLDEATAFAAGHRPCCECRRDDFHRFKSYWLLGNPGYNYNEKSSIKEIDNVLHEERMDKRKLKITFEEHTEHITNGCFVTINKEPYLFFNGQVFLWSPFGYAKGIQAPATDQLTVLTPRSVVNTFRAGYLPQIAGLPA